MPTVPEAIQQGLAHQRSGNLPAAEHVYRQILAVVPQHPDAQHLLGLIAAQQGRADEAIARISAAIAEDGSAALYHHNLGNVYLAQQRPDQAEACYRAALDLQPDYIASQRQLAGLLQAPRPTFVGRSPDGCAPDDGAPQNGSQSERAAESAAWWRRVLARCPEDADALNNLGVLLADAGDYAAAREHYQEALGLRPDFVAAHNNLGNVWLAEDDFAAAEAEFLAALRLDSHFAPAHHNLGLLRAHAGRLAEAEAGYRRAIELDPHYAAAHADLGILWLLAGDFQRGWPEYEWRRRIPGAPQRSFQQPTWDGSPLAGRTILLHAEEGLGDTLQFVRLASLVQARGGRVLLECPAPLCQLLGSVAGVERLVAAGRSPGSFDVQAPLLALPGILKLTAERIPNRVPYLQAEPARVSRWRERLAGDTANRGPVSQAQGPVSQARYPGSQARRDSPVSSEFRIGITWQGSRTFRFDRWRSIPLAEFAPLAVARGVRLFSLQKGPGSEQLAAAPFPVTDLGRELDSDGHAFVDTAAVLLSLDLVITSDTALAHLAGALGVPTWVALPYVPDWRWQLGRSDSPWYPTLRLFRQERRRVWADVFSRMAAALAETARATTAISRAAAAGPPASHLTATPRAADV